MTSPVNDMLKPVAKSLFITLNAVTENVSISGSGKSSVSFRHTAGLRSLGNTDKRLTYLYSQALQWQVYSAESKNKAAITATVLDSKLYKYSLSSSPAAFL